MLDYAACGQQRGDSEPVSHHLTVLLGWLLLLVGGIAYLGGIVTTILRVNRQYSRVLPGAGLIRGGAAVWAATRLWYLLIVAVIGAAILLLSR
jgi:hypothetical protein